MTHVFLPLDEEAIPAGIPFSLKVILEKHNKIANIWNSSPSEIKLLLAKPQIIEI